MDLLFSSTYEKFKPMLVFVSAVIVFFSTSTAFDWVFGAKITYRLFN